MPEITDEEKRDFIKTCIVPNKLYVYNGVQYWLYHFWDTLEQEELTMLQTELSESLELMTTSSKNTGVYLFCKMFEAGSMKEQKKLLKGNVKDRILELFEKNTNVVHFFIKVIACFDDSVTLNTAILQYICNNFMNFLRTKEGLSLMLFLVNGDYDREFFSKQVNRITQNIRDLIMNNSGKKPYEQKLTEVRKIIFSQDQINSVLNDNLKEHCFENSQFCVFVGLALQRLIIDGNYTEVVENFIDIITKDLEKNLKDLTDKADDSEYHKK